MRGGGLVVAIILFATGACGGDDDTDGDADAATEADADAAADNDEADAGDDGEVIGQDPDFDLGTLPDGFPPELVPPEWDTGQYTEALTHPTATFESSMSFDDVVAYYDDVHGESLIVGDPGEELAQWTKKPPWIVSVFNGDPMLIGITEVVDG